MSIAENGGHRKDSVSQEFKKPGGACVTSYTPDLDGGREIFWPGQAGSDGLRSDQAYDGARSKMRPSLSLSQDGIDQNGCQESPSALSYWVKA